MDLDRGYGGVGLRWTRRMRLAGGAFDVSVGADHDRLDERRRGYVNAAGRRGELRRDEDDAVSNSDAYVQAEWSPHPRWTLGGGRSGETRTTP